jgi:drug/metabolite transporter (DMT)-like permease
MPKSLIRGYSSALLATLAGSTVYIFSKAAFSEVSLPQFGFYWFLLAIFWNSAFALSVPEHRKFRVISKKSFKVLIWIGLIEIVATTTFYWAISVATNAAIPSFLRNMEYIFVALMGVVLLGERFVKLEFLGVILTIFGVLIISYNKDATFASFITGTSGLMVVSTVFYAIRTITAKKHIDTVTPIMLAINRAIFLFIFAAIFLFALNQSLIISRYAFFNILIGSFLGPFLTSLGQYNALKHIEASRSAIFQSTTALFVLLGAYLYFGKLPLAYQITGGLFTIIGAILLIVGRKIHFSDLYKRIYQKSTM